MSFMDDLRKELWEGQADALERLTLWLGPIAFAALVVGGLVVSIWKVAGANLGSYLEGVGAGTGLLTIGHSVHRASRRQRDDGSGTQVPSGTRP